MKQPSLVNFSVASPKKCCLPIWVYIWTFSILAKLVLKQFMKQIAKLALAKLLKRELPHVLNSLKRDRKTRKIGTLNFESNFLNFLKYYLTKFLFMIVLAWEAASVVAAMAVHINCHLCELGNVSFKQMFFQQQHILNIAN